MPGNTMEGGALGGEFDVKLRESAVSYIPST